MRRSVVMGIAIVTISIVAIVAIIGRSRMVPSEAMSVAPVAISAQSEAPMDAPASTAKTAVAGAAQPENAHRARSSTATQIARTAKLSLFVGNPDSAVGAVSSLARRRGGDVLSLELAHTDASAPASATMQIRVPAQRFDDTIAAIAAVGNVRERTESAQDLTGNITDSSAKLTNLRRTEADIRQIMDRSGSIEQVLAAENQLSDVREQIETLESELKTMRTQVVYSTIDLTLQAEAGTSPVEPTVAAQLATTLKSALHALSQTTVALIGSMLWLLVFLPYAALVAVIARLVMVRLRKSYSS